MPKTSAAAGPFLSLIDVSERLGVSVDTVRRLIRSKQLRPVDLSTGRVPRWYVDEAELARFINRRTGIGA